jgi:hypothetical protein
MNIFKEFKETFIDTFINLYKELKELKKFKSTYRKPNEEQSKKIKKAIGQHIVKNKLKE